MIYAVVLATGKANERSRALDTDGTGRRYIDRIQQTARAAGIERVIVVVGPPDGEAVRKAMSPGVAWVANPRPDRGPMSSVQVGLTALPAAARAAILWPVELALVDASTVRALLAASAGAAANKLIVPTHDGLDSRVVRLPRALFGEVSMLPLDSSLERLIAGRGDAVRIAVDDAAVLGDGPRPQPAAKKVEAKAEAPKAKAAPPKAEAKAPAPPVSATAPAPASPATKRSPRPRPAKAQ